MLKIHQIFIIKFLAILIGTLLVSSIISYIMLKSIVLDYKKEYLENMITVIELNIKNINDFDSYILDVHRKTNLRFTVVSDEGTVLAESNADKTKMDNHSSRYEIMESNNQKYGYVTRYSKTLKTDFLYVAKKTNYKDKKIYIRISTNLSKVMDDFYSLWYKLIFAFFIMALISFYIAQKMNNRIVYDINQITHFLDEISNKNYKAIVKPKYFFEFLQISLNLKNLVKKLASRDKQKRKHTAKLRLMNKQRNDILSSISHEFKNPIASIMGYAQTLQEDLDINIQIREKFLSKIISNGEKISLMLDRLALSVKLENQDLDIEHTEFDFKSLCEEVMVNISSKYKDRNIIVDADNTIVNADKTMMELVLINLVDNALKYSQSDVKIILKDNILSVEDKGIGVKEEYINKITAKFFRVDKNSWDNSMGIGLAMVSYILKAHNTTLDIKSEFGNGSVFSFNLKNILKIK